MSYRANFLFKKNINSITDFFEFIKKLESEIRIKELKYFFFDEIFYSNIKQEEKRDQVIKVSKMVSDFKLTFFYWEKFNMLGTILSLSVPSIENLFDGSFYFQNSTDQDYEEEDYIFFDENIINIINDFNYDDNDDYDNRTIRYNRLVELLSLYKILGINSNEYLSKSDIADFNKITISPFHMKNYSLEFQNEIERVLRYWT